jgi:uncharacterized protein YndB with AHSA1/START domain
MPDILNRVEVQSSADATYRALATIGGLAGWWTSDTKGEADVGGTIKFTFGTRGFFDMKVLELQPGKRVLWQVVDGPEDWIGTKVAFDLKEDNGATVILFKHQGWKEPSEFMHHCSTKWAMFLMSLKGLLETGKGTPYPNDVHITVNWD